MNALRNSPNPLLNCPIIGYAHHRLILDSMGQPCDYEFLEVNQTFEKLTGLAPESIIGNTVRQAIPGIEDSAFDWIGFYGDIAQNGGEQSFDQFSEALGRWYRVHAYSSERLFFTTVFVDITESKRDSAELEHFFDVNLDLLCIADVDGYLVKTNRAWSEVLGYAQDELNSRRFLDFVHPEDVEDTLKAMAELAAGRDVYDFTNRYRSKDGSYRYLEWRTHPRGHLSYAAARDVTDRILMEQKLAREKKWIDLFFDQSLHGFFFCMLDEPISWHEAADREALIEYMLDHQRMTQVNQAMLDQYGATAEDFVGITARELLQHDLAQARELFVEIIEKGKCHVETYEHKLDGTPIIIDGDYICLYDDQGRVIGHFGVQVDVTERKQAELKSQELLERLRKLTAELPGFVYQYQLWPDQTSAFVYASSGIRAIYGVAKEQVAADASVVFAVLHPDDLAHITASIQVSADHLTPWHEIYRVNHPEKGLIWVEGHATPERLDDGSTIWHGYIHDVTRRHQAELAASDAMRLLQAALEGSPSGIVIADAPDGHIRFVNRAALEISAVGPNLAGTDVTGVAIVEHARRWNLRRPDGEPMASHELPLVRSIRYGETVAGEEAIILGAQGKKHWITISSAPITRDDGKISAGIAVFSDITQQKQEQLQLQRSAHYDALTGLPNRVLLADRLDQAMAWVRRSHSRLAVAFIDLDRFKPVNDQYGHDMGDTLLIGLGQRMRDSLRDVDTLARFGGDEFVAVLSDVAHEADARVMVERLLNAISAPIELNGQRLQVTASIGVTFYPQSVDLDADQLLRQADQAMYQAKVKGRNAWHRFDWEQDEDVRGRHVELERIRAGLRNNEFVLHYQPQVNMRTGAVFGVEALVRWQHPKRGLLPPAEFLPVIEHTDVDVALGQWVLSTALAQWQSWAAAGLNLQMAVNLSVDFLQQPDFVERTRDLLAQNAALHSGYLELEILESSALSSLERTSTVMRACQAYGVRFTLDDFGTGYSSLSYLKLLPVAAFKVDRSFVQEIDHDIDDLAIVEGLLGLSRAFGLQIVAEGVETLDQGRLLLQLGYEHAQGYAIARPMPAAEVMNWIAIWRPPTVWSQACMLTASEYPLLRAQVALLRAIHGLANCLLPEPQQSLQNLQDLVKSVDTVLGDHSPWPERHDYLAQLATIQQRLAVLINRACCPEVRQGVGWKQQAELELQQLHAALQTCREHLT